MEFKIHETYGGFELISQQEIKEIQGVGRVFYHKESGATLFSLQNKDPHKVFSISFKTLPENNKGTAHIVEHAVCCASEKYPLKETFMALQQGSICTVLNACTYPDMTMYYVASPHEKDLLGIAQVYIDLVFHPLIYSDSNYFKQEGWHYDLEDIQAPLEYTGVVYHEMEGEYSEASTRLEHYIAEMLFPNNFYRYDSGGIPDEIVTLTENEFLNFHKKYYYGANSYLYLYGDMDILSALQALDEAGLKHLERKDTLEPIKVQETVRVPKRVIGYYPSRKEEEDQALLSLSFIIGKATDHKLRLSFELLEHMLLRSTASPLLKTLILEEELGVSLSDGGYDACKAEPVFSIVLKGSNGKYAEHFEEKIFKTLEYMVNKGIDQALVEAALQTLEFQLRESDASYEPIGVQYSEMILNSYLYGGEPFVHLCYEETLQEIREKANKGYFENLIKKYLLDNPNRGLVVLKPSKKIAQEEFKRKTKSLEVKKLALGEEGCKAIIEENEYLESLQLIENTPEQLRKLPYLSKKDMPSKIRKINKVQLEKNGVAYQYHNEETKGIAYIHLLFDTRAVSQKDIPYIGLLAHLLTYIGTQRRGYSEVENAINTHTGGINCAVHAYQDKGQEELYYPIFKISSKVLYEQLDSFRSLMEEILTQTIFNEKAKLKEMIGSIYYEMHRSFVGAPEYRASQNLYTYFSETGVYEDQVCGIQFYHFIKQINETFEEAYIDLKEKLQNVYKAIFTQSNCKVSITAEERCQEILMETLPELISKLNNEIGKKYSYSFQLTENNIAYGTIQNVQAIAQGFQFRKAGIAYHGSLEVVMNILENTYLWDRVRLQGGAYGCDILMGYEGHFVICSYCDPNLIETLEVYRGIPNFLEALELEEESVERYIVSALGMMHAPMSMEQCSERAVMDWMTGGGDALREKIYEEILETDLSKIKESKTFFDAMIQENRYCIIGDYKKIKKHKKLFDVIDSVF